MTYQQLKEKRDLLVQRGNEYREKIADLEIKLDKYEKVLDEIIEYIKNENYKDENICVVDGIEILQILDKVKDLTLENIN